MFFSYVVDILVKRVWIKHENHSVGHCLALCYGASWCVNTGGAAAKVIFGRGTRLDIDSSKYSLLLCIKYR